MNERPGPLPGWLIPLSRAAERVYAAEVARRSARFDSGRGVVTLDRPVISVGNLTVGGTGKSPTVAWAVALLLNLGRRPAIAMRGYMPRGGGRGEANGRDRWSDEADAHRRRLPGVPVVARPDRVEGLIDLFASDEGARVDSVVLDDGFQHRRLARQLDLVLIDAAQRPGVFEMGLLPRGWLREPPLALRRAHAVLLTHADRADPGTALELKRLALEINPALTIASARHAWTGIEIDGPGHSAGHLEPVGWLRGRRVLAACGIARPRRFLDALRDAGADLAGSIPRPDHAAYTPAHARRLAAEARRLGAEAIVTTDKDWSKLRHIAAAITQGAELPIARPTLTLSWIDGGPAIEGLIAGALTQPNASDTPATSTTPALGP